MLKRILTGLAAGLLTLGLATVPAQAQSASVGMTVGLSAAAAVDVLNVEPPAVMPNGQPTPTYSAEFKRAHPNTQPRPVKAPKGAPPAPPGTKQAMAAPIVVTRHYAGANQAVATWGAQGLFRMGKPYLDFTRAYHSLVEIAAQNQTATSRDVIELGMAVAPGVNGGSFDVHLFGGAWIDNVFQGWNGGAGYVDYGPNTAVNLGTNVTALGWTNANATVSKRLSVQYANGSGTPGAGVWWLFADNNWVGYFPESAWNTAGNPGQTFGTTDVVQVFGEVAHDDDQATNPDTAVDAKCSDMGTGGWAAHQTAQTPNAARVLDMEYHYPGGVTGALPVMTTFHTPNRYTTVPAPGGPGVRSWWFGGPGQNANGTTVPNGKIGGC